MLVMCDYMTVVLHAQHTRNEHAISKIFVDRFIDNSIAALPFIVGLLLTERYSRSILLLNRFPWFFLGVGFHLYNWSTLQQNLAIAPFSNFLCLFSNRRHRSNSTNRWPLWMTLIHDLDLMYFRILSYNSVPAEQNIPKFLQSVAEAMAILQMQKYP